MNHEMAHEFLCITTPMHFESGSKDHVIFWQIYWVDLGIYIYYTLFTVREPFLISNGIQLFVWIILIVNIIHIFDVLKLERQYGVWQNLFFQYVQDGGDKTTHSTEETKYVKDAGCIYKMLLYKKTISIGLQLVVEVVRHSFAWRVSFRFFQEKPQ